jgi:magnesium chelatase family protein
VLARTHAFTIDHMQVRHVSVEVDVRPGLPAFTVVGLADAAVREARERIHAAIRNSGLQFPAGRITANLAPGDLPKARAGLDLAIACSLLAASGQCSYESLARVALLGELALDGTVRPAHGALAVADAARRWGISRLVLAGRDAAEAQLVAGLDLALVDDLRGAVDALEGRTPARSRIARGRRHGGPPAACAAPPEGDLADVRGQHHAVRALVIAAAGGHSALLSGPPGAGKTMLAHRIPSILPALSREEAIELARLSSLAGAPVHGLPRTRPFRAPHHSITMAGLVGGAQRGRVGEVVLAHNGVLFLDELTEFARATLEALRQPLEDGRVAIVRAGHSAVHPARFILIAATNPCPCGFAGEGDRCDCSESELARHRRRLSGPLLDRMDLIVHFQRASDGLNAPATISSTRARALVAEARSRQAHRFSGERFTLNARMDAAALVRHARLDSDAGGLLDRARAAAMLSARGEQRVLRVARTIADLNGHQRIRASELGAALAMRALAASGASRAA